MSKLSVTPIDPTYEIPLMGYCPYMEISAPHGSYKTLTEGLVAPERQASSKDVAIPESLPNGGLYNAPQATGPWANIPVIPTDLNLIQNNLRSAHPPPGATEQYIGTERIGNNYAPMIGVYWYNLDNEMHGMYRMNVTKKADEKQY
jgi:hypothetical protein